MRKLILLLVTIAMTACNYTTNNGTGTHVSKEQIVENNSIGKWKVNVAHLSYIYEIVKDGDGYVGIYTENTGPIKRLLRKDEDRFYEVNSNHPNEFMKIAKNSTLTTDGNLMHFDEEGWIPHVLGKPIK